jgi:hypothetical protein
MRLPHLRFTVRRMMVVIAMSAAGLACLLQLREDLDPGQTFQRTTGLTLPASSEVMSAGGYREFHGDGVTHLVFDADPKILERWLSAPPPWGSRWKYGPIDPLIPHCYKSQSFSHLEIPESNTVRYVARGRTPNTEPPYHYHNGEILAIDPGRGRVWFASWDY